MCLYPCSTQSLAGDLRGAAVVEGQRISAQKLMHRKFCNHEYEIAPLRLLGVWSMAVMLLEFSLGVLI